MTVIKDQSYIPIYQSINQIYLFKTSGLECSNDDVLHKEIDYLMPLLFETWEEEAAFEKIEYDVTVLNKSTINVLNLILNIMMCTWKLVDLTDKKLLRRIVSGDFSSLFI